MASLSGSHLTVTGDAADNSVEITVLSGQVQLRGLNSTTINGGAAAFVVAANTDTVTGNVLIHLAGGNDSLGFSRSVKFDGIVDVHGEALVPMQGHCQAADQNKVDPGIGQGCQQAVHAHVASVRIPAARLDPKPS